MIRDFSPRITSELVTLTYPYKPANHTSLNSKVLDRFLPRTTGGRGLAETLSAFEPDIVYSDSPLYAGQFRISSLLRRKRIPLILHLRGDWWQEYRDWFDSVIWRKRLVSLPNLTLQSAGTILASKITPICRWLEQIVRQHTLIERTEVVYQGVDPILFFPESGFEFQRPAVAIIQNHTVYRKVAGLLDFYEVIARAPDIQFYIAEGEAVDQSFLPQIKRRFQSLPNVHFLSGINSLPAVRKMLTASDCYVLASGLDCCPTTILEASLMNRPVIASRIGGVPEIVLENQTGWTIENDDVDSWVEKIRAAVSDRRLSESLGRRGRQWVSAKFAWTTIAKQVESILTSEAG
jgi:glycosyltransferase involved in cell wall biosynthesis